MPVLISRIVSIGFLLCSTLDAEERPNIISIVTDDQGRWTLGAYGNRESRTPHMDRLAREGATFLNAFVPTPVCSPSRASFLTGLYGTQVGITDWISTAEAAGGLGLPPGVATWPAVLQKHGYKTALVGKWHLGEQSQYHPTRRGFDHFFGFLGGGNTPMNPTLERNGKATKLDGSLPDLLVDDAIHYVEANRDRPFGLLVQFRAPHLPYGPVPDEDTAPFLDLDPTVPKAPGLDEKQVKRLTREYYASIHSVDRNLGRLLAKLDELDLTRRTIVLFTSDHGYNLGHHGIHTKGNGFWMAGGVNGPKRPNMWDTSIRVPLLVRWPGVVKPGSEVTEPVTNIDTFSSVLGMLGVPAPAGAQNQGADFSPLLRGEQTAPSPLPLSPVAGEKGRGEGNWRDAIFGQYELHNGGQANMRMIRTSDWKLVRFHLTNQLDELYHLAADPDETTNLYNRAEHRETRDRLQARLTAWQKSINDPILELERIAAENARR